MEIEATKLDGVPEEYRVLDVDLSPSGKPVVSIGHPQDSNAPGAVLFNHRLIDLPPGAIWQPSGGRPPSLAAFVRCAGENQFIVVTPRGAPSPNTQMYGPDGQMRAEFPIGYDVEVVLANSEAVVACYGDEGHEDTTGLDSQGMCAFDLNGTLLWRYSDRFPKEAEMTYVFAATWTDEGEIAVFCDIGGAPALLRLDIAGSKQTLKWLPEAIKWASAISLRDRLVIFDGWPDTGISTWDIESDELVSQTECTMDFTTVTPPRRGLPGGRFITPTFDGYRILSFD